MKKVFYFIAALLVLVGVVAALVPAVLSSEWGKNKITGVISRHTPYEVHIGKLSLSWFKEQQVEELTIVDADHSFCFVCPKLTVSAPLLHLLLGQKGFKELAVYNPKLIIQASATSSAASSISTPATGVEHASAPKVKKTEKKSLPLFTGNVRIENGEFVLLKEQKEIVSYRDVQMHLQIPQDGSLISLNLLGKTDEGKIALKGQVTQLEKEVPTIDLDAEIKNFPLQGIDELFSHFSPEWRGLIIEGVGNALNLDLKGAFSTDGLSCNLKASSSHFIAEVQTATKNGTIFLSAPGKISLDLTPQFVEKATRLLPALQELHLQEGSKAEISIDEFSLPSAASKLNFDALAFKGSFTLSPLGELGSLQVGFSSPQLGQVVIQALSPRLKLNNLQLAIGQDLRLVSPATILLFPKEGAEPLQLTLKEFSAVLPLSASTFKLVFGIENSFSQFLGPELIGTLQVEPQKGNSADKIAQIELSSQNLNLQGTALLKQTGVELVKPVEGFLTLTKESFSFVDLAPYELTQQAALTFHVSRLYVPFHEKNADISLELGIDKLAFADKSSSQAIRLENLLLHLDKPQGEKPILLKLTSQIQTKEGPSTATKVQNGQINISAEIENTFSKEPHALNAIVNADVQEFPTSVLDFLAKMGGFSSPSPFFGEKLQFQANVQIQNGNGPLKINLHSPNAQLYVVGALNGGVLTLSEPLFAQLKITDKLSALLLKEVNPLSVSAISTQRPITFVAQRAGFSLPLADWKKISFDHGTLEIGQVSCRNEGNINIALGLLKSKQLTSTGDLPLWFAPMDLRIKQGKVSIDRTEVLVANTYEIALWGGMDLIQQDVDMVLGLTAQCLSKAFGIKNLPNNYVLQIPLRGKMDDVKLDKGAATTKIGVLMLWQKKAMGGSGVLGGVGDLIGKLGALPDANSSAPPAKHPFPWETNKPDGKARKSEGSTSKKKNRIKTGDKPLKQIMKLLR